MTSICNTATFTLIVFLLQITELKCKKQYLNTLASHNYDQESFLLVFLSAAFSLLVIMLQTSFSLYFAIG